MSNCILITGLPAVGKSTLAGRISGELGIPVISKDSIKEVLFDTVGFRSREDKLKLGTASTELMLFFAGKMLGTGSDIILDNNFEDSSMESLKALAESTGCNMVTVRLDGEISAVYQRFIKRDRDPRRHPGHVTNVCYPPEGRTEPEPVLPLEVFEKRYTDRGMRSFRYGPTLQVDATDPSKVDSGEVLEFIRAHMEGGNR